MLYNSYLIPIMVILEIIGMSSHSLELYLEIPITFFEGVCLITFFGMEIAAASFNVDAAEALHNNTAKLKCITISCKCYDKKKLLFRLSSNVSQFMITKPLLAVVIILAGYISNPRLSLLVSTLARIGGTACTVSAVFTILSCMLILYKAKAFGNPDLKLEYKFVSIKLYFLLLVCDGLFIVPILKTTPPPHFACVGNDNFIYSEEDCSNRFMKFIILCQTVLFSLLVFKNFTASELSPPEKGRVLPGNYFLFIPN